MEASQLTCNSYKSKFPSFALIVAFLVDFLRLFAFIIKFDPKSKNQPLLTQVIFDQQSTFKSLLHSHLLLPDDDDTWSPRGYIILEWGLKIKNDEHELCVPLVGFCFSGHK